MSKLDKCPNCQSQRLADVSGLYDGQQKKCDCLILCYECQKCWGYRNNGQTIDFTGRFEEANTEALGDALNRFLDDGFLEQQFLQY